MHKLKFQVEDYVLCGDTRISCKPLMNGTSDDEQKILRDIHEGQKKKIVKLLIYLNRLTHVQNPNNSLNDLNNI